MANNNLRSMFSFVFLFGPLVGSLLLARFDFVGLFCGTVIMFLVVFMASFLIKNSIPPAVSDEIELTSFEEKKSPNLLKNLTLLIHYLAFTFLHVGQWRYLLNMTLFVTSNLGEADSSVCILFSNCSGL